MMVYGDPQYKVSSKVFLSRFIERVNGARENNIDDVRALLIQAGQLEQGMADAGHELTSLTDAAAVAFCDCLKGGKTDLSPLKRTVDVPDLTLTIKIPEGYEFYAVYPEQYVVTAEAIAKERPNQRALVVGIRSIGTSLSAVASAVLRNSQRCTVRPEGDPFNRKARLPIATIVGFDYAIIVDEGPGLSGSSIAAVWSALNDAGMKDIVVIPGHPNEPGAAGNESTRTLWRRMEKRFTPAEVFPGQDLSAGKWRETIDGDWPAAFIPFERAKYLSSDRVLWKFAGLGAIYENGKTAIENAWGRMQALAAEGFGPQPLEAKLGFIAMPWLDGMPLTKADARDPAVVDLVSEYVVRFAGLPLDPEQMRAGQDRLSEMAIANTREQLGEKWARVAEHKLERGRDLHLFQSYGDGRMAPHEWVRNSDGRIFKLDSFGHDTDHTLVGAQSVVWDLAGLILEWELSQAKTAGVLDSLTRQGICLTREVLHFYEIAYAAFKMGLCNFCGSQTADPGEKARLATAEKGYCHKLLHVLNEE